MRIIKLVILLCGFGGLAINIRSLFRSINNNDSVVLDLVGIILWILYIFVLQYNYKIKKEK